MTDSPDKMCKGLAAIFEPQRYRGPFVFIGKYAIITPHNIALHATPVTQIVKQS